MAKDDIKVKGQVVLDVVLQAKNLDKEINSLLGKIKNKKKDFGAGSDTLSDAKKSLLQTQRLLNERAKSTEKVIKGEKDFAKLLPSQQTAVRRDLEGLQGAVKEARKSYAAVNEAAKLVGDEKLAKELNQSYKAGMASVRKLEASNKKLATLTDQNALIKKQENRIAQKNLAEKAAYKEQGTRDNAAQTRIQSLGKAELAAYAERDKKIAGIRKAERDAYAEQEKFDKAAQTRIQNLGKAELAAYRERDSRRNAEQTRIQKLGDAELAAYKEADTRRNIVRKAERAAYREQEKQDTAKQNRIQNLGKAELAAYAERDKKLNEVRKAERAAYKEQARQDKVAQTRIQKLGEAELAAYREVEAKKAATDKKVFNERNRLLKQEDSLRVKRQIADKIAREHGAKNFEKLSFRSVNKEDIRSLQDYAKARLTATNANLDALRKQGASAAQIGKVTKAQQEQQKAVVGLDKAMRNLNHPLKQINLLFRQFFRFAIGYGVLYQMLGAVKALVGGIVELDEALKSIQAITGSSIQQMEQLETTIKQVATTTKFSTGEIAAAAKILGQAGVSAQELPDALRATADFAAATNSQLEIAADLITTTRNVFKDLSDNTLADQLTKAINISKLTAADLKTILSISAQTAQSYNLTAEQYLGAVTTLRNAGIKASTVATGLRQGLLEIFSPTARTAKALKDRYKQLGENITEEVVKQRFFGFTKADNPLLAVLAELKRLGFADEAQKEFQRAFNVRASNAIKALVNNYDELAEAEAKITFGVSAAEAAEIQMQSLSNSLKNLGAAFTVLGDAILGGGVGSLETFTDKATEAITKLAELDIELKSQGKKGLGAGLLPGLIGGAAGAIGGKTVKGKLGLGALGLISGTAAGVGDEGGGVAAAGSLGLSSILGYLGLGGLIQAGFADKLISKISKLPLIAAMAGTVGTFGLGTIVASLLAIGGLFLAFSGILTDADSAAEEAALEAEGARGKLEKTRSQITKLEGFKNEYDVGAARKGENSGKSASTLVGLQNDVSDFDTAIDSIFGTIIDGKRDDLFAILKRYSNAGTTERKTLAAQLKGISEVEGEGETLDRILFDLSTGLANASARSRALFGEVSEQVNKANQILIKGIQENKDLGDKEFTQALGIVDAYKNNPEIRDILQGVSTKTREQQLQVLEAFYGSLTGIVETGGETLSGLIDKEAEQQKTVLQKNIAALLASSTNDAVSVEVAITNVVNGVRGLRGSVTKNIDEMTAELERQRDELLSLSQSDPATLTRQVRANSSQSFYPIYDEVPDQDALTRRENAPGLVPALEQGIVQLQAEKKAFQEQRQLLLADTVSGATAQLEEFREIIGSERGSEITEGALKGVDNAAGKAAVRELFEAPGKIQALIDSVRNGGISLDDVDEIAFSKGLEAILAVLGIISNSSNTALEAERRAGELAAILPSPARISRIDALTKEIGLRKGKNKVNIDTLTTQDASNPIIERRNLQIQEDALEVRRIQDQIKKLGDGSEDEKTVERRNQLRISLNKAQAKQDSRVEEAQDEILKTIEIIEDIRVKTQARVHALELIASNQDIGLAGAGIPNIGLFDTAIDKIDQVHDEMLEEFRIKLIRDGIKPGTELFRKEMENRAFLLRDLQLNSEKFSAALNELTSGLRKQAALLASRPVTTGVKQDATSDRLGTQGRERRRQKAENQLGANVNLRAEAGVKLSKQQDALKAQEEAGLTEDAKATSQTIEGLSQEIYRLDQSSARLLITTRENSSDAETRANAALGLILPVQQLNEALQDSEFAFANLADSINEGFLDAIEGIGDALAYAIIEGENFVDAMLDIFYDIFKEQATTGIKTLVTELAGSALSALPAGVTSLVPGLSGAAATAAAPAVTAAAGAATGAVTAGVDAAATGVAVGTAVTAALIPATLGMQAANTQMFLAGTTLTTAAGALSGAAGALTASATTSGIGGILATGGTIGRAGITNSFAGGGIISGPGTGTSDSILGVHQNGSKSSLIAVSNGEAILTERATNLLGDDFIHMVNAGKMKGFADGAVMGRGEVTAGAKPATAAAAVSPSVTNKNDTTIVNAIDSSSVVAAALETPSGGRAILNYLRANKSKVSRIIG